MSQIFWVIFIVISIIYLILPVDILPDIIPFAGRIDDLIFPVLLFLWMKKKFGAGIFSNNNKAGNEYGQNENYQQSGQNRSAGARLDPYEILNISRGAGEEEIKKAYRELIAKYHPDKVSHLGEDLQKLAHEKIVQINNAYKELKKRRFSF